VASGQITEQKYFATYAFSMGKVFKNTNIKIFMIQLFYRQIEKTQKYASI
jgi:hypothetical protein